MQFVLSLITSGSLKWVAILIIVGLLGGSLYMKHREIVDLEKKAALQEYNINQLEQNIKDKEVYLQQMKEISKHKSEIVANLYIMKDRLEAQLKEVEANINTHVGAGHDRPSSKILKDTFKSLGELK
jgi:sortase (surface protein transpeptidase)